MPSSPPTSATRAARSAASALSIATISWWPFPVAIMRAVRPPENFASMSTPRLTRRVSVRGHRHGHRHRQSDRRYHHHRRHSGHCRRSPHLASSSPISSSRASPGGTSPRFGAFWMRRTRVAASTATGGATRPCRRRRSVCTPRRLRCCTSTWTMRICRLATASSGARRCRSPRRESRTRTFDGWRP